MLLRAISFDYSSVFVSQFVVALKFSSRSFSFLLIAVYAAPSIPTSQILDQVSQVLLALTLQHIIIARDFKAKSPLWGGQVNRHSAFAI